MCDATRPDVSVIFIEQGISHPLRLPGVGACRLEGGVTSLPRECQNKVSHPLGQSKGKGF